MSDIDSLIFIVSWALPIFWSSIAIGRRSIISSILAAVTWLTMGLVNTLMAATGTYVTAWLGLSFMYYGTGVVFIIVTIYYALTSLQGRSQARREEEEMTLF